MTLEQTPVEVKAEAFETMAIMLNEHKAVIEKQQELLQSADDALAQLIGGLLGFRDWINQVVELWNATKGETNG